MPTRIQLPKRYDFLCMNVGAQFSDDPADQLDVHKRNAKEIYDLGIRKVRMGGTSPQYVDLESEMRASGEKVAIYKAQGFYVENGATHLNGVDPQLTATNWQDYHDYAVTFATILYSYGLDTYMMGNEMIGSHYDNTTLTLQGMYTKFVELAQAIRAVCPNLKLVYNGTANEMAQWTTWINSNGAIPEYMQLGFNLYGSSATDLSAFQTQVNAVAALDGYVSEWSHYYDWAQVPFDEEQQYSIIVNRLKILEASGLDSYFWTWKYYNRNATGDWNKWALLKTNANHTSPQIFDTTFYKRPAYYALFPQRRDITKTKKSMGFNGSSGYAVTPITPESTGISIGFWYLRYRFLSSNAEHIIGNLSPTDGYLNGFRLYHDQASTNIVLQTASSSSNNNFRSYSPFKAGRWVHIAVTINSSGAILYIDGVAQTSISGNLGTPSRALVIGARPIDYGVKGQFFMSNLTIENTDTRWTQEEITTLKDNNTIPSGATQWSMNGHFVDQNGVNPLTVSGIGYAINASSAKRTVI